MTAIDLLTRREDEPATDGASRGPLAAVVGPIAAAGFGVASAVRRARIFHPDGAAYRATVDITEPRGGYEILRENILLAWDPPELDQDPAPPPGRER